MVACEFSFTSALMSDSSPPQCAKHTQQPKLKEWTWIQKVSGKQSFNDGLARLDVWWVGTARVVTMSNLSLPHKSLPQFLIS